MVVYLVDTSVLIDFLKGKETDESVYFESLILQSVPFGIAAFTFQEVLQGARDATEYNTLQHYLSTQRIYYPSHDTFETAARLFYDLRKKGITIRSTIDTLIAATAIENELTLLCSDRDFVFMQKAINLDIWYA